MVTTSPSLLDRLRRSGDAQAWDRFVELYTPFIFHCVRRVGVPPADAADLVQEVFLLLLRKLPAFEYDRGGSFGAWLRVIAQNKCRDHLRVRKSVGGDIDEAPPAPDGAELFTEEEHRRFVSRRALELMQAEFQDNTWKACWEHVVGGRSAAEIAAELGISVNAVYVAKSRVLRRLREELRDLVD